MGKFSKNMKKWAIGIGVIVLVVVAGYFFLRDGEPERVVKNDTIVAFGDSLVVGYGATEGKDFVSVLGASLGVPIENFGKNGDTSADALARIDTVLARDPGLVILLIGGNDFLRKVPIETTEENIRSIVSQFEANGTVVVLVGVRGGLLSDPFAPMYASIADDYDLVYVPNILSGLLGRSEYMSDAIHPNDAGYARIAERLEDVVAPLLGNK